MTSEFEGRGGSANGLDALWTLWGEGVFLKWGALKKAFHKLNETRFSKKTLFIFILFNILVLCNWNHWNIYHDGLDSGEDSTYYLIYGR